MSTLPRRRLIRPAPMTEPSHPSTERKIQRLRSRLDKERAALARWMSKLKRAFHTVEKTQQRITRLERQIARNEG
jgi:predicted  nucleic acid-binding Zn-ribbon protein